MKIALHDGLTQDRWRRTSSWPGCAMEPVFHGKPHCEREEAESGLPDEGWGLDDAAPSRDDVAASGYSFRKLRFQMIADSTQPARLRGQSQTRIATDARG
jgi:hypothetical protein